MAGPVDRGDEPAGSAGRPALLRASGAYRRVVLMGDTASMDDMQRLHDQGAVRGFTTNPTLLRRAGVRDCAAFAAEVLDRFPDIELSIPVLTDDLDLLVRQARLISSWGASVYAKVPVVTRNGTSLASVIAELRAEGIQVNATAITAESHVRALDEAGVLGSEGPRTILSVLGGRIADSGQDAAVFVKTLCELAAAPEVGVLWASVREVSAIYAAEAAGARYVTAPAAVLERLQSHGLDLQAVATTMVASFLDDARVGQLSLPGRAGARRRLHG